MAVSQLLKVILASLFLGFVFTYPSDNSDEFGDFVESYDQELLEKFSSMDAYLDSLETLTSSAEAEVADDMEYTRNARAPVDDYGFFVSEPTFGRYYDNYWMPPWLAPFMYPYPPYYFPPPTYPYFPYPYMPYFMDDLPLEISVTEQNCREDVLPVAEGMPFLGTVPARGKVTIAATFGPDDCRFNNYKTPNMVSGHPSISNYYPNADIACGNIEDWESDTPYCGLVNAHGTVTIAATFDDCSCSVL